MDNQMIANLVLAGYVWLTILILFIFYVIEVIGSWKVMNKFGEPGWKSLIPFYRVFVEFKYTWNPHMMWIATILPLIGQALRGNEGAIGTIGSILAIVGVIFVFIGQHKLSKAFGHGVGFTLGLILLPGIFTIILGFGQSRYIGKQ